MKNNEDVLNLVFKKNENIEYKVNDSGIVIIQEKQDHKIQRVFRKLRFKIPMYHNIELDEYGSFIFLQVDGNKNVKESQQWRSRIWNLKYSGKLTVGAEGGLGGGGQRGKN